MPGFRARIAVERIWTELKRLLEAPDPVGALALMRETGLLREQTSADGVLGLAQGRLSLLPALIPFHIGRIRRSPIIQDT